MAAVSQVDDSGLAIAIPLYVRFSARRFPIVGTTLVIVGIATALALTLVFALSVRLRQREIRTVFRIGGSRLTIARLVGAEIAIVLAASAILCAVVMLAVSQYSGDLVRALFIG